MMNKLESQINSLCNSDSELVSFMRQIKYLSQFTLPYLKIIILSKIYPDFFETELNKLNTETQVVGKTLEKILLERKNTSLRKHTKINCRFIYHSK